jgi:hypothetical protein
MDDGLLEWEAYVSGGQPDTPETARIFFVCLDARNDPARYVVRESRSVAEEERTLIEMSDDELRELLTISVENV